ncbi:MAG TPA: hypothetical protein VF596_15300 [Pyrinomonadaceae bacterium]|jgi:hypothetical protein
MAKPIFKWSGEYIGFIHNGNLFDPNSKYLGWVEKDGSVWTSNGRYFGDLVEENYILRNSMKVEPIPKIPKIPPISPISPISSIPRLPRIAKIGWYDPFDK